MAYYINQKCRACKSSLTGGYVSNYSGIGEPFIICDRCGEIHNNSDKITEWKLKSQTSKLLFILKHVFSVLFYYGLGAVMICVILLAKGVINSLMELSLLVASSCLIGLLVFFARIRKAVDASNARMKNMDYIRKLRSVGIRVNSFD